MYVVYHKRYKEAYASDPAASSGRIEWIKGELEDSFQFIEPSTASEGDLRLVYSQTLLEL